MKLLFPVTGIVVLSGVCCCGDFMEGFEEGMEIGMKADGEGSEVTVSQEMADGTKVTSSTTEGGTLEATLGGSCGRYKDWGMSAPSGWSVQACSDDGTNGGLTMNGGSDPSAACKDLKGWATGKGFSVSMENEMAGTTSIILEKDATRMTMACTSMGGMNNVSIALSPK
ncbi:MAG: hypothetical protein ACOZNI_26800 [Myxococcota bacterium]